MIPTWVDGELIPVEKLEAHRRGLRHKAVSVFVMDGDEVLLQQRAAHKYHTPGLWANTCCTHPGWDESDADCARRRLAEELGITGLDLRPRGVVEYRANVGGGLTEHEVVAIFVAETDRASLALAPNPEEVQQTRWARIDTLEQEIKAQPEVFTPWLRIYLRDHKALILGADSTA